MLQNDAVTRQTILLFIITAGTLIFKHETGIQSSTLSNTQFEFERTHEKCLTTRLEFILLFLIIAIIAVQFEYRM